MKRLTVCAVLAVSGLWMNLASGQSTTTYVKIGASAEITATSYCLRNQGRDPVHVRKVQSYDVFVNNGPVWMNDAYNNTVAKICPAAGSQVPIQKDDELIIKKVGGAYTFQLKRNGSPLFANGLPLQPSDNFSMYATANGYDYFILIGDGDLGDTQTPDEPVIDKYYHVEVFPVVSAAQDPRCVLERPNVHLPVYTPANPPIQVPINISEWKGDPQICFKEAHETSTGGGGEHPPGFQKSKKDKGHK